MREHGKTLNSPGRHYLYRERYCLLYGGLAGGNWGEGEVNYDETGMRFEPETATARY